MTEQLPYFELSWAILSTMSLGVLFLGLLVRGITGRSIVLIVPLVASAAGALANGLCYVAFYSSYPLYWRLTASAIADISWLVRINYIPNSLKIKVDLNESSISGSRNKPCFI